MIKAPALARAYALAGRRQDALRILDRVKTTGVAGNRNLEIAQAYFALGEKEEGFRRLTIAFDERQLVIYLKYDPQFDSVSSDPRFQSLVARLKIPDLKQ